MLSETIQSALAPVFLLVATSSLMTVFTGRLARVVDRSRVLMERRLTGTGADVERTIDELRSLDQRVDIINRSIGLCVATGIVVCIMVPMLFLFGAGTESLATPIAVCFIIAMLLLFASLGFFMAEVRLAVKTLRVPIEMLTLEADEATAA